MDIYTAESDSGDVRLVASYAGLTRTKFRALVLRYLDHYGLPNPDDSTMHLDLCRWTPEEYAAWLGKFPPAGDSWSSMLARAKFDQLQYSYPGVWQRERVTEMPEELRLYAAAAAPFEDDPRDVDFWSDADRVAELADRDKKVRRES